MLAPLLYMTLADDITTEAGYQNTQQYVEETSTVLTTWVKNEEPGGW